MSNPYSRLEGLGLQLISAGAPVGNFLPGVQVGNLLFLAGQGPRDHDGTLKTGRLGENLSVTQAQVHARPAIASAQQVAVIAQQHLALDGGGRSRAPTLIACDDHLNCQMSFLQSMSHPHSQLRAGRPSTIG